MEERTFEERLAFIMSYGVDEEEARLVIAINDVAKIQYRRLQEQYGFYGVPFEVQFAHSEESRKAYCMIVDARNAAREKEKAAARRATEKAAKEAKKAVASGADTTSEATTSPAQAGTSVPRQRDRVAPAQPSGGSADEAAKALAAFSGRPDQKEN